MANRHRFAHTEKCMRTVARLFSMAVVLIGLNAGMAWAKQGILDYNRFMTEIEPLLLTKTYASPGPAPMTCVACHGDPTNVAFSTYPMVVGQSRANFIETARRVKLDQPDVSLVLLKPLATAAGGVSHGLSANNGGKQFANTTTDIAYQTILNWIADASKSSVGARVIRTEPYPNPFRFSTELVYFLTTEAQSVDVKVFTEGGHEVRDFTGTTNVGANRVTWNGRDENNEPLQTGVYFYLVKAHFEDGTSMKTGRCVYMP
jgi:hypothetical protein